MALGNLNINVNANVGGFVSGMDTVRATARAGMAESSNSINDFQSSLLRASQDLERAANMMGSNMQAANDAIINSSEESAAAVEQISSAANNVKFDGISAKIAAAASAGFGAAYAATETWLQKIEDWTKTKLIILGVAIVAGVTVAVVGALYAVYEAMGFIGGLFTGSSYKSASIDALIAINEKVKDLQASLNITAVSAMALSDALGRLGVPKEDYVTAYQNATSAIRTNGEELDRLGVKYKDQNGKLLDNETFLKNVKSKLDEYTAGWDRNQAATAIGAGTYAQITSALKVNREEIQKSKDRLDDYNLGIGVESQDAVAAYQKAMLEFNNEVKLTGDGFSRAWSDQIMPALTSVAEFLKEGFPFAVNAFRYSMATLTSLFYGLKEVVFIVTESILQSFASIGDVLARVAGAFTKAMHGDFTGAWSELKAVPDDLGKRWETYWANMNAQSEANIKAMKLAWAMDDRSAPGMPTENKKTWVPKPAAPAEAAKSAFQAYMDELDRMNVKVMESEYSALRLKAAQLAEKEGITDTVSAIKIANLQRNESLKIVDEYGNRLKVEAQAYADQGKLIGKNALDTEILTNAMKRHAEVQSIIDAAEKSRKPIDAEGQAALWATETKAVQENTTAITENYANLNSWSTGSEKAFNDYRDHAGSAAMQSQSLFSKAFKGMEDALVNFVMKGKLDFSSLANGIISDMVRIQIQRNIMIPLMGTGKNGDNGMMGSFFSSIGSMLGFAGGGDPPVGIPSIVGENGPELFVPKTAGTIIPNGASGGGVVVNVVESPGNGGQTRSRTEGGTRIIDVLVEQVKASIASDIGRGNGAVPASLERTYGMNRAAGAF